MIRYALDTSVLVHWFAQTSDPDTEKALRLREEHLAEAIELIVLDQSLYELIHLLKESAHFDQDLLASALASLEFMHITVIPYSPEVLRRAAQIACGHDISLYAACPVALGAHLRCQVITADEMVFRKVATLPWTLLLSDLRL